MPIDFESIYVYVSSLFPPHLLIMPQLSYRRRLLKQVKQQLQLNIALESSSNDSDDELFDCMFTSVNVSESIVSSAYFFQSTDSSSSDSSNDSDTRSDMSDSENPNDLLELYFLLYNTRYFVLICHHKVKWVCNLVLS